MRHVAWYHRRLVWKQYYKGKGKNCENEREQVQPGMSMENPHYFDVICIFMFYMVCTSTYIVRQLKYRKCNRNGSGNTAFLYGLFMPWVHRIFLNWKKHKIFRFLYWGIFTIIGLIATLVVIESSLMIHAAGKKPEPEATVLVLGCRVYGERPSLSLQERLEAAYAYLSEHPDADCVLSGGKGNDENISEAECMYRYLVSKGIEPERLYKEEQSTTTRENLFYSKQLMEEEGLNTSIAIVTSEYHEYRAGLLAKEFGITYGAVPGKTAIWLFPTCYVRELYGILREWIF